MLLRRAPLEKARLLARPLDMEEMFQDLLYYHPDGSLTSDDDKSSADTAPSPTTGQIQPDAEQTASQLFDICWIIDWKST